MTNESSSVCVELPQTLNNEETLGEIQDKDTSASETASSTASSLTSSSKSSSSSSSSSLSSEKLSNVLVFPSASTSSSSSFTSSFTSSIASFFSPTPSGLLKSAILSTTTLLTFPLTMDLLEGSPGGAHDRQAAADDPDADQGNLALPICLISSPSPPPNKFPLFPTSSSPTLELASFPVSRPNHRSASLSSSSTLSSAPSLASLQPVTSTPCSSPLKEQDALPNLSLSPPKDGFAQRKLIPGKKLSVAINPAMNRLMDGCHTVGVYGPSRERHKRESILHKSDFLMRDMSPAIRSSLGSFNDSTQEEAIITPYAQLLNSLRNIRNNYFVVANLSPMRSRRLSAYDVQKTLKSPPLNDEQKQKMALDTLEEIEFCLDKLENMQTHPSAAQMAAHKFRQILNREISQNPDFKTGGPITGYLMTFLETGSDEDASKNGAADSQGSPVTSSSTNLHLANGSEGEEADKKSDVNKLSLESFMSHVTPDLAELLESTENSWGVDLFELASLANDRPLTYVSLHLFQKRNLLRSFRISDVTFYRYMSVVEENYHSENSYHNNIHATDVLQATHFMLFFSAFKSVFSDLEIFAALFSAAIHDVDHPGVTNQFLINTGSELAVMYNDESVLENHHVALAFKLLNREGCDILAALNKKQRQTFRKMVISMVLATDMGKHLQHVANLKTMVEVKRLSSSSSSSSNICSPLPAKVIDHENHEDKMQILQSMVHCSDLSNPLKPLEVYLKWTDRIMEEFFKQGDREKELGLEVSPLCDRDNSDICKSQIGFIDYVVHPLWETWGALTQPDCQVILDYLENNRVWLSTQDALTNMRNRNVRDDSDDDEEHNGE